MQHYAKILIGNISQNIEYLRYAAYRVGCIAYGFLIFPVHPAGVKSAVFGACNIRRKRIADDENFRLVLFFDVLQNVVEIFLLRLIEADLFGNKNVLDIFHNRRAAEPAFLNDFCSVRHKIDRIFFAELFACFKRAVENKTRLRQKLHIGEICFVRVRRHTCFFKEIIKSFTEKLRSRQLSPLKLFPFFIVDF